MSRRSIALIVTTLGLAAVYVASGFNLTYAQTQPPAPAAAAPAPNPTTDQYKRDVGLEVEAMREDIARMNDQVFSFAELGFQEFETSKYLTDILRKNGFTIQENLAGIPTAFMASWGSGKPVIAMGSDIDCIPQASQKPGVAYHEAMIESAPGHGEGHNSGMPLQIAAALAACALSPLKLYSTETSPFWLPESPQLTPRLSPTCAKIEMSTSLNSPART